MSRAGGENYYRPEPVRVVIIDTQYVETDAASFKSVVQSLTGKDSVIPGTTRAYKSSLKKRSSTVVQGGGGGGGGGSNKMTKRVSSLKSLDRGVSFKDLDRLLMEFPSMDELYRLCAD